MEILSPQNARVKGWAQLQEKNIETSRTSMWWKAFISYRKPCHPEWTSSVLRMMWRRAFPRNFVIYRIQDKVLNGLAYPMPSSRRSVTRRHRGGVCRGPQRSTSMAGPDLARERIGHRSGRSSGPGECRNHHTKRRCRRAAGVVLGRGRGFVQPQDARSTMGSLFHLPVLEGDLLSILPEARNGARLVTTLLEGKHSCFEYDFKGTSWIVIGSEGRGVSPEVAELVDDAIRIPMPGKAESLNAAMARRC